MEADTVLSSRHSLETHTATKAQNLAAEHYIISQAPLRFSVHPSLPLICHRTLYLQNQEPWSLGLKLLRYAVLQIELRPHLSCTTVFIPESSAYTMRCLSCSTTKPIYLESLVVFINRAQFADLWSFCQSDSVLNKTVNSHYGVAILGKRAWDTESLCCA